MGSKPTLEEIKNKLPMCVIPTWKSLMKHVPRKGEWHLKVNLSSSEYKKSKEDAMLEYDEYTGWDKMAE